MVYGGLLVFIGLSVLATSAIGPDPDGVTSSINTLLLILGVNLLSHEWQRADARSRGRRFRRSTRVLTLVFPPAGITLYLLRTRRWQSAARALFLMASGILAVVIASNAVGDWLEARGIFPLEVSEDQ